MVLLFFFYYQSKVTVFIYIVKYKQTIVKLLFHYLNWIKNTFLMMIKKVICEDSAAPFFSTISHNLKKQAKKYPILFYLYYLPVKLLCKFNRCLIKRYETKTNKIIKILVE